MIACAACADVDPESRGARLRAWLRRVARAALGWLRLRPRARLRGPQRYEAAMERHASERIGFSSRTR